MDKITKYLDTKNEFVEKEMVIKSPYVAALQEARNFTGRNSLTGEKNKNVSHGSWLGAVGYMIVLDHIGNKFNNPEKENRLKDMLEITDRISSFTKALIYFSDLSYEKILALYSLRCSFVHDFFLFNINKKNILLMHHFVVTQGSGEIVTLPNIRWDGDLKNRNINATIVNLESLGDLVEKIHKELLRLANLEKLKLNSGIELESLTYKK
jgi:uncharacterized protein with HEPN domain